MTATRPPLFEWKDEYSLHIPEIDSQHKKLVSLLNDLHAAMLDGRAANLISRTLTELVRYTRDHFAAEEAMLKRRNYPGLEKHRLEHQALTKRVLDLERRVASGTTSVTIDVLGFLKDWLRNHIMGTDRQYALFLKAV